VLCATDDACEELASDIEALHSALFAATPAVRVCHFPTWDQSPYSPIAPSLRTRIARVAALSALSGDAAERPRIVVTTVAAACQAALPRGVLRGATTEVAVDASVESREALALRLSEAGYLRVDPV